MQCQTACTAKPDANACASDSLHAQVVNSHPRCCHDMKQTALQGLQQWCTCSAPLPRSTQCNSNSTKQPLKPGCHQRQEPNTTPPCNQYSRMPQRSIKREQLQHECHTQGSCWWSKLRHQQGAFTAGIKTVKLCPLSRLAGPSCRNNNKKNSSCHTQRGLRGLVNDAGSTADAHRAHGA